MNILNNLLSSDGFTPVNKKLAREIGPLEALFLGELIRQRKRFGQEEFYFTQPDMENEIGISGYRQNSCTKKLEALGILKFEKKGLPAKNWYFINDEKIMEYLSSENTLELEVKKLDDKTPKNLPTRHKETCPLEAKKLDDYSNKNDSKNNNKNKEVKKIGRKKKLKPILSKKEFVDKLDIPKLKKLYPHRNVKVEIDSAWIFYNERGDGIKMAMSTMNNWLKPTKDWEIKQYNDAIQIQKTKHKVFNPTEHLQTKKISSAPKHKIFDPMEHLEQPKTTSKPLKSLVK